VWDGVWAVQVDTSAKEWIDNGGWSGVTIDGQISTTETVCIDPDAVAIDWPDYDNGPQTALYNGSLECLDEPDWVFRYDSYIIFYLFYKKTL